MFDKEKEIIVNTKDISKVLWWLVRVLMGLVGGCFTQAHAGIIYSNDPTLSDFTSTVTSYATFSSGYQPTTDILLAANYPRVIGHTSDPIGVSFSSKTANIVVFDNIDHPGYAWDVFQYKILGSNDDKTYTLLFDPIAVNEPNSPGANAAFTLKPYTGYTGTAPTLLNNTVTAGLGSSAGNIGYEEYFTFDDSYQYFRFAPSSLTLTTGENETELSAVGIGVPSDVIIATAPEPTSLLLAGAGLVALASSRRRNGSAKAAVAPSRAAVTRPS